MIKKRIIPCLDVKNGRVVKGINFVDLKDAGDPVEQAKIYSDGGADEICFLDITASNENRDTIYYVVEKTSKKCFVPLTVGGGVRSVEDINKLLNCGADKVSINTAAVQNPEVVIESSNQLTLEYLKEVNNYGVSRLIYTDIHRDGMKQSPNFAETSKVAEISNCPVVISGGVSSIDDIKKAKNLKNIEGIIVGKAIYDGDIELDELVKEDA